MPFSAASSAASCRGSLRIIIILDLVSALDLSSQGGAGALRTGISGTVLGFGI